jgi:integrase
MADKLDDMTIRNLKPKDKEYTKREKGGFGVRILPSGRKVFFYLYRIDGQRRFLNIGTYKDVKHPDGISFKIAYDEYEMERAKVKALKAGRSEGVDPVQVKQEKRHQREEEREAHCIEDLIKEYLQRYAEKFKRSWKEDERILNRNVLPKWGKRKATSIKKRDINLLLEDIVDRGAPAMANNTFKIIRRMFNYAVEKDILPHSPAVGIKLPSPKVERERALSETELKKLLSTIDQANMSADVCRALKMILVTAQRPSEVVGMHVHELDGCWWTIPSSRAKNGKTHRVYLTKTALDLIDGTTFIDPDTGVKKTKTFIFPCPHKKKDQSIHRHALSRAIINNCPSGCVLNCDKCDVADCKADPRKLHEKNRLGVAHFTPHDLRRTAATFMAQQGEMDEVIDAVLNHAKKGVIKVYNQYRYDKEKQAALEKWEQKLLSLIEG